MIQNSTYMVQSITYITELHSYDTFLTNIYKIHCPTIHHKIPTLQKVEQSITNIYHKY